MSFMIAPYKMIVVNLIASILLIAGVFIYKKFARKKINLFALLILTSILPVISVFRKGVYESGDFVFHIYRAMSFYDSLKDGVLIPSWGVGLNEGFGYPVFIFIYNIPYYLMSFLHSIGLTFIFSEKLILSCVFVGSGVSMWFLLKKLVGSDLGAFTGSTIYLFAPYHLVDLHFRVAISESLAFAITPIIFFLLIKTVEQPRLIYFAWMSLLWGILFLTHPPMFIFYSVVFLSYISFQLLTKRAGLKTFISFLGTLSIGLLISSFAIVPRFTLIKYTTDSLLIKSPVEYLNPIELLFSPWRLGFLFQGPYGELSFVVGYAGIFILLLSLYLLIKKGSKNKYYSRILFWIVISFFVIFFMLPYSRTIWDMFPLLRIMQFAYRLLHPLIFCLAILSGYLAIVYYKKKTLIYIFIALSIGYTMLNWGNRQTITNIDDAFLRKTLPSSTRNGEQNYESVPLWWNTEKDFLTQPKSHLEIVKGSADIKEFKRTTTRHIYGVNASGPTTFVENTLYFPNWKITVDGKSVPIEYQNSKYNAKMVFNVPEGLHYIKVSYSDIKPLRIAKVISLGIFFLIVIYLILYYTSRIVEFTFTKFFDSTKSK